MPISEDLSKKIDETIEISCELAKNEQLQNYGYADYLTALATLLEARAKLY